MSCRGVVCESQNKRQKLIEKLSSELDNETMTNVGGNI
jgi:hypothetical protein